MATSPACPDENAKLLRIGEIAAQTGTTLRTLHYYEELDLVRPAKRTKGGFRLYNPDAIKDVQYVQYLRELGLELPQIQTLVEARRAEEETGAACMQDAVEKELRRVKSLIHRYNRLRDELEATLDILAECVDRKCEKTPGGSHCAECCVMEDRVYVPTTFCRTQSKCMTDLSARESDA